MNALEFFFRQPGPAPDSRQSQSHNTLPIRGSITHIDGYPRKLVLYLMEASPPYWQVRYFEDGRTFKRSTRTTRNVFNYIEMFDNPKRRHNTSRGVSPVEFEKH